MVAPYVLRLLCCKIKPARLVHDFVIYSHVRTGRKIELSRVEVRVERGFLRQLRTRAHVEVTGNAG